MSMKMKYIIHYQHKITLLYFMLVGVLFLYNWSFEALSYNLLNQTTSLYSLDSSTGMDSDSLKDLESNSLKLEKKPKVCILNKIEISNNLKTDKNWILKFLKLKPAMEFDPQMIPTLKDKLLTTQIYYGTNIHVEYLEQDSDIFLLNDKNQDKSKEKDLYKNLDKDQNHINNGFKPACNIYIDLDEKWTLIPVVRGAVGGGTPLLVYGLYDTHSFGRFLTLGGEVHTYGSADPGGVLWMKYPRWLDGRYFLGLQLWKQNTSSDSYDSNENKIGTLKSSWYGLRSTFLFPLIDLKDTAIFQAGFDYFIKRYKKHSYDPDLDYPPYYLDRYTELYQSDTTKSDLKLKLLYDDVVVDRYLFDGLRVDLSLGGIFNDSFIEKNSPLNFNTEIFYYKLISPQLNIATHLDFGISKSKNISDLSRLGGFDSIRGYQDGFMYGNKYGYLNLELRSLIYKTQLIHFQGVAFSDMGTASLSSSDLGSKFRYSYGLGLKILVPSIYRMVFRFDYAIGQRGNRGLAFGTSDFFDAYKPL